MTSEARLLALISDRVVVKLPSNRVGFEACRLLTREGVRVNMTLCFTLAQVVEAGRAGALWLSPFIGRIDDAGNDGARRLSEMLQVISSFDFRLSVLAASLRTKKLVEAAILAGVQAVTLDPEQIEGFSQDDLSDSGIAKFASDWRQFTESKT
jgi:transaldolase